jgi:Fic family protein
LGLEIANTKGKLELEDIINIHCGIVPSRVGLRNRAGVYIDNRLGEVIYMPPQDEKTILEYLENLFQFMNSDQPNTLIKIILTHYQFEAIHPFFDGNGRMGRILMALQFCLEKKLRYPILYTSGYIINNKSTYYELFREIQHNNNWQDWIVFHLNGIINQAKEGLIRINEIAIVQKNFKSQLNNFIKIPLKYRSEVESYFFEKAFYTQADMSKKLSLSRNTVKKYLEILYSAKILKSQQIGTRTLYFIPEFVDIVS